MRIGNFEVDGPLPDLKAPHAFAMMRPWINCGSVGSLVIERMETQFGSVHLARLARPGNFYDFTRYRPNIRGKGSARQLTIPNTNINWARGHGDNDFVFLHLLEPHMLGEDYAESVWQILKNLKIQRYCLLGSFYDAVPHTRPTLVNGDSSSMETQKSLEKMGILPNEYEGPVTICHLISQEAEKAGIETMMLMAHLPQYVELDEDYMGILALLQTLHSLYGVRINESDVDMAGEQQKNLDIAVQQDTKLKALITQLESQYDADRVSRKSEEQPRLSPEVDRFLKEMEKRIGDN